MEISNILLNVVEMYLGVEIWVLRVIVKQFGLRLSFNCFLVYSVANLRVLNKIRYIFKVNFKRLFYYNCQILYVSLFYREFYLNIFHFLQSNFKYVNVIFHFIEIK